MRILFDPKVPTEVRAAVEPLLRKWEWLIPTWVHQLTVFWNDKDSARICNLAEPEYRRAWIALLNGWLTNDPETRERDVVHELIHFSLEPIASFAETLIERTIPDEDSAFRKWADEELRRVVEGCTVDLQNAITDQR